MWGFGKLGQLAAEAAECTAGLTLGPHVALLRDLDETCARHPDAFVVHAGHALGEDLVDLMEQCARRGLDVVTSSGFFHPTTEFPGPARQLDELARSTGARIVAAGLHPGFLFDVLPATVIPIAAGWRAVEMRKSSSAASWPKGVRHMQGIGETPAAVETELPYPMASSARLLSKPSVVWSPRSRSRVRRLPGISRYGSMTKSSRPVCRRGTGMTAVPRWRTDAS